MLTAIGVVSARHIGIDEVQGVLEQARKKLVINLDHTSDKSEYEQMFTVISQLRKFSDINKQTAIVAAANLQRERTTHRLERKKSIKTLTWICGIFGSLLFMYLVVKSMSGNCRKKKDP